MTKASTLPPVQMLWVDGPLSALERLAIVSFLENGHPVHLYTYGLVGEAPEGTTVMDGREIMADGERFVLDSGVGHGSLAPFSNRFRYKLLFERGGIWCDTDVVLLKPMLFAAERDYFFATEYDAPENGNTALTVKATSCAMQVPAGSELMKQCFEQSMAIDPAQAEWGATGVRLLQELLVRHRLEQALIRPNIICPVPFWDIAKLLAGLHTLSAESHAIHFYNEMFRRNFFDKNGTYEPHCIYERLKTHYLGKGA